MLIRKVLSELGVLDIVEISPFKRTEDGSFYSVWKVVTKNATYVLKKAKDNEVVIYKEFLQKLCQGVPKLYNAICFENEYYLLLEFIDGVDMCKCNREILIKVLDSLIYVQDYFWENKSFFNIGCSFDESYKQRVERGKYLNDFELEEAYQQFLEIYQSQPKTLCHDDLLPFNVLINETATIIDWEIAGILPYPTSLARLIAHTNSDEKALFYMSEEDREFAINYYYEKLIKSKGITYSDYRNVFNYFLLYEYCEWIMLGVKYFDADMSRYNCYLKKAKNHLIKINTQK